MRRIASPKATRATEAERTNAFAEETRRMHVIRRVLIVALFVALLAVGWNFADGNGETISVDYLIGATVPLPIWMWLGLAWISGGLLVALYLGFALVRGRVENRRLRKALGGLEDELRQFRNRPIEIEGDPDPHPASATMTAIRPARES